MLRGQVGTSFQLKVERPGEAKPLDFTIVRKNIQLPFIPYYSKLDNNIGYINLSTFSGNPSKEFKKAFLDLKKQGITSLVIDLRNNGGGLLEEAVEIANYFLPRGKTIVTTKGKIKQASNTYKTLREPLADVSYMPIFPVSAQSHVPSGICGSVPVCGTSGLFHWDDL